MMHLILFDNHFGAAIEAGHVADGSFWNIQESDGCILEAKIQWESDLYLYHCEAKK